MERFLFLSGRLTVTFETKSAERIEAAADLFTLPERLEREPLKGFEAEPVRRPEIPEAFREEKEEEDGKGKGEGEKKEEEGVEGADESKEEEK